MILGIYVRFLECTSSHFFSSLKSTIIPFKEVSSKPPWTFAIPQQKTASQTPCLWRYMRAMSSRDRKALPCESAPLVSGVSYFRIWWHFFDRWRKIFRHQLRYVYICILSFNKNISNNSVTDGIFANSVSDGILAYIWLISHGAGFLNQQE